MKEKEVAKDDGRRGEEKMQAVTDRRVRQVDQTLATKEADLMEV